MAKFRINCCDTDDVGYSIPGTGCGDLEVVSVELYPYLDRDGEQIYISFNTDGKFFFTEEQAKYIPDHWSKKAVIKLVEKQSKHGRNLDVENCQNPGCKNDVLIELIEEGTQ